MKWKKDYDSVADEWNHRGTIRRHIPQKANSDNEQRLINFEASNIMIIGLLWFPAVNTKIVYCWSVES